MSMKARVRTDASGNITIHIEGGLNYENSIPFRKELEALTEENPMSQITLDLDSLDFVGSSGIGLFVETLKTINQKKDQIRLCNVKSEFLKVFKLYDLDAMEVMIQEFENDDTEMLNQHFGNRRNTFQN